MKKWYGYVMRDEEMIDTSTYEGNPKMLVEDATRVGKGVGVITYMSNQ